MAVCDLFWPVDPLPPGPGPGTCHRCPRPASGTVDGVTVLCLLHLRALTHEAVLRMLGRE
jgi:hypothetical protein